jgi:hypothetical protein
VQRRVLISSENSRRLNLTGGGYVRRRDFIKVIAGSAAWPFVARAQQPTSTIRRIGILLPESASAAGRLLEAFRQGLKEMGWVEGQTLLSSIVLPTAKRMHCRRLLSSWFNCDWTLSWRKAPQQPRRQKMPRNPFQL